MKAIITKYLPATATKGARIKATDGDLNSLTLARHYDLDCKDDFRRVAEALRDKMNWKGNLAQGSFRTYMDTKEFLIELLAVTLGAIFWYVLVTLIFLY